MATRSKPNWKVLDSLLPVLEQEGCSSAQIAEDWGMSLATLEGHLRQEGAMSAPPKHDYPALIFEYDQRLASGESTKVIQAEFESRGIHVRTFLNRRSQWNKEHRSTPQTHHDTPKEHPRTPEPIEGGLDDKYTQEHPRTLPEADHTEVHPGTLEGHQEIMEDVYQSVPDAPHISTDAESSAEQSADTGADELFSEHNGQSVDVHRSVQLPVQTLDTGVDDSADISAELGIDDHANHLPVQRAVQQVDTGQVQSLDTGAVQRLDRLEAEVRTLAHAMRSVMDRMNDLPVHAPLQITAVPSYPKGKSVRWNLWILEPIRDELATMAAEREMSPSQLVQELLWKALSDQRSSLP